MNDLALNVTTVPIKKRSKEDFTELVLKHSKFLRNFIVKKCWDKQDVDDIYQTVLMEAFRSFNSY